MLQGYVGFPLELGHERARKKSQEMHKTPPLRLRGVARSRRGNQRATTKVEKEKMEKAKKAKEKMPTKATGFFMRCHSGMKET